MAHHADSSKANQNPLKDARVGGIWRLGRKIGSGSFGDIYKGKMLVTFVRQRSCLQFISAGTV